MWIVSQTPSNYKPGEGWPWCIIDPEDGDVHDFYRTQEAANAAFVVQFGEPVKTWDDYTKTKTEE